MFDNDESNNDQRSSATAMKTAALRLISLNLIRPTNFEHDFRDIGVLSYNWGQAVFYVSDNENSK